jgi:CRISPR system Cascade subunit CasB
MTLYALHQQSKTTAMHEAAVAGRAGNSLGTAVARLLRTADDPSRRRDPDRVASLRRRFNALVTASTTAELVHHLRGLVQQLRAHDISLGYGRLAADLVAFQNPNRVDVVRRRWARDLAGYREPADKHDATPAATPAATSAATSAATLVITQLDTPTDTQPEETW